jgi:two-component system response regulator
MAYLRQMGPFADPALSPRPSLILLDLNMPRLSGKEVLALLKSDPDLKSIPVVVFTTSSREEDVIECYRIGANSYVPKPTDFAEFQFVMQYLELYWLQVSLLPAVRRRPVI